MPHHRKIDFVGWKVVMEFRNKRLIVAGVGLEEVRVSFFFRSTHEWTSSSWDFLFIRGWLNLFIIIFVGFLLGFSFVWAFRFICLGRLVRELWLLLLFVLHEGTLRDVIRGINFGVVECRLDFRVGVLRLFFGEEVLKGLHDWE